MQFFWLDSSKAYVRTQGEAIKSKEPWRMDEIPTDKDGLMKLLNDLHAKIENVVVREENAQIVVDNPIPGSDWNDLSYEDERAAQQTKPMDAGSILSRMDEPGVDVEGVIEYIAKSKGYALGRFARAVATRFQELGKI